MVGHVFELLPMFDRHTTAGLLFVQEGLDQQRRRQDFVTWAVEQVRARHVGRANRFALTATQTVFDAVSNGTNVRLLHDERLVTHQTKTRCVSLAQVGVTHARLRCVVAQQFAFVKTPFRVDPLLVVGKGLQLSVCQKFELGDADTVLT